MTGRGVVASAQRVVVKVGSSSLTTLPGGLDVDRLRALVDVLGALRARVKELRDAHLTTEQIRASAEAEGMTLYMTLPALVFGLIFLVAAMLKIFGA